MKPMTLTIPARPEWVLILRMAASGVGALYDLPCDAVSDLSTAIDESCDLLLHQPYCAESLTLTVEVQGDGLHLSITAEKCKPRPGEETSDPDIARLIIETLVRKVDLEKDESGVREVRMLLPASVEKK